jgi:hypothetical protein
MLIDDEFLRRFQQRLAGPELRLPVQGEARDSSSAKTASSTNAHVVKEATRSPSGSPIGANSRRRCWAPTR